MSTVSQAPRGHGDPAVHRVDSSTKGDNMVNQSEHKECRINFSDLPKDKKIVYISSDTPDYEDFKTNWLECHDESDESECPAEGSAAYWQEVSDNQAQEWDDFKANMKYSPLMGKTCLFFGRYNSRYPDYQPSGPAGKVIEVNSVDDFLRFISNSSNAQDIYIDKDGLHVVDYHHDGSLSLDVLVLTKKGEEYWNRHDTQSFEVHKHLAETNGLTRKVNFYLY